MKKASVFFVVFCVVSVSFFAIPVAEDAPFSVLEPASTHLFGTRAPATRYVGGVSPGNYSSVQAAVDASSSGDTVRIYDGTYYEDVYLNKTLNLIGNGSAKTTINGTGYGNVVTINADWCNISAFSIIGSGETPETAGLRLNSDHNHVTLINCSRNYLGIFLNGSNDNNITNNVVEWNYGLGSVSSDDALAHWRMDESSWSGSAGEVKDSSGHGFHGTPQNGVSTTTGRFGRAGSFDGVNDCIDCGLHDEFNFTNKVTLMGWVYVKGTSSWPTIISKRSSWHLTSGNGINYWRIGGYVNGGGERRIDSSSITLNKWYHIAGSYDGDYFRVYINGKLDKTSIQYTGNLPSSNNKVYIGPLWGAASSYQFNGLIDEVRAYDRVLSDAEIYNLYASNSLSNETHMASGVVMMNSANNTIGGNQLNSNSGHGIQVSSSVNNTIHNNTVKDNCAGGVCLTNSYLNTVSDNTVTTNHGLEPSSDGLLGSWQFVNASWDGTLNEVRDSSGLGRHASASGNAKVSPAGRFGRAAEFDGAGDYLNVTTPVILDRNVTYGGWIKWRTIAADGSGYDVPIQQADALDVGYEIYTDAVDGKLYAWDGLSITGGFQIDKNVWYHVYVIHRGTHFALFVNGSIIGGWVASTQDPVMENFTIGGGAEQGMYWFDGFIDDVRVYNSSLSNEELNTTYLTGVSSGVYVRQSGNNTVQRNNCTVNEGDGIGLFDSMGNLVEYNLITDNLRSGMTINSSNNNFVSNNTAEGNLLNGIHLDTDATFNNITYNILLDNGEYGVHINKSTRNRLHHNLFLNDPPTGVQASDDGSSNDWDWSQSGNYWSEHQSPDASPAFGITDTAYDLDGSASAKDDFPLCSAIQPPVNVTPYEDLLYSETCSLANAIQPGLFTFSTNANAWLTCLSDGSFSGTPTNAQTGAYWINASVTDKYSTFYRNFTITVMNTNDAPVISTADVTTATEDSLYSNVYSATDIDLPGDTLTWSVATAAGFLGMDPATGTLSGTPLNADVGVHTVNVTVSDGNGGFAFSEFDLTVDNTNDAPVITTANLTTATEDQLYSNDYDAYDIDPTGDDLLFVWSLKTNMSSSFLSINPSTGVVSGTPDDIHVGQHWVNVTVGDTRGGFDSVNFTLTVINVNDPPVIITADILDAYEDQLYYNNYAAADEDVADTSFTWYLDTNADFLDMEPSTGNLSGTPDQNDIGNYWVNVTVADGNGGEGYTDFTLTVHNTNDAPVWTKTPPSSDIMRNSAYTFDPNAVDADPGAELSYGITSEPVLGDITIDAATGEIAWTPLEVGVYNLNLSCTDSIATIYHEFTLTVLSDNHPPTTKLTSPVNNTEIDILNPTLSWTVYDTDGDDVVCDVYFGLDLSDVKSFAPSAKKADKTTDDFFKAENLESGKAYFWTVVPYDGEDHGLCLSGYYVFTISETALVNHLPEFTSDPSLDAGVDVEWTYEPVVIDKDNDTILLSLESGPDGMVLMGATLEWTPKQSQLGENDVELKAFDGKESSFQSFTVTVTEDGPGNRAPIVVPVNDATVEEGQTVSVQVEVTDPDGDFLIYEVTDGPDGSQINSEGLFTWKTAEGDAGTYEIVITVEDGEYFVTATFNVTIQIRTPGPDDDVVDDDDDVDDKSFLRSYWWIFLILLFIILLFIVVVVIVVIVVKKRKKDDEKDDDNQQVLPEAQPPPAPAPEPEQAGFDPGLPEQAGFDPGLPEPGQPSEAPPGGDAGSVYGGFEGPGAAEPGMPPDAYPPPGQDPTGAPPAFAEPMPSQPDLLVPPGSTALLPPPSQPPSPVPELTPDWAVPGEAEPQPAAADHEPPGPPPGGIVVQCYNCSANIPVSTDERPLTLTCPGCGQPSLLE